jgi:hypothetical protein
VHKFILICTILILLFSGTDVYKSVASHTNSIPEIRSGIGSFCLDDHHDGKGINSAVDIWTCNGTKSQGFVLSFNKIKHLASNPPGQCLGVLNSGKTGGDKLVLNNCSKDASQNWAVDQDGLENTKSSLCLNSPSDKIGTNLVLGSCNNLSTTNKAWAQDIWTNNNGNYINCARLSSRGQKVACFAQYQWSTWQSQPSLHSAMLNDYTDGNSYEEWCADFVSYVYKEAGYPFDNGERDGWDEYDANNIQNMGFTYHSAASYVPRVGDVAFFDYPGGHVEIVVKAGMNPQFIYGDSGTTDPITNNGEMNENTLTNDGMYGQVTYYLSP